LIDPTGPRLAFSAWGTAPSVLEPALVSELTQLRTLVSSEEAPLGARALVERACARWRAEYLAPLVDGDQLYGVIAVAPKAGGGLADTLELEALGLMCLNITAALASARLYERLRGLSDELEQKAEARSQSLARTLADLRGAEQRLVQSEKLAALGQIVGGVAADLTDEVCQVHALAAELRRHAETLVDAANRALAAAPGRSRAPP
jgi:GAF domain-containing protein